MFYVLFKNKNVLIFIVALFTIIITVNFALPTSKSMSPIGNALHKRQGEAKDPPKAKEQAKKEPKEAPKGKAPPEKAPPPPPPPPEPEPPAKEPPPPPPEE